MTTTLVDITRYRGRFFEVLQETERTQTAVMTIEGAAHQARAGAGVLIPAGALHHVRNPGAQPLFFLTVYAPPAYSP
jgi:oxalate decarboxylase/phosphoglucose isomerase-like protein (cupin superfamily)